MSRTAILLQALVLVASAGVAIEVGAAAPRTFVASNGSDTNPCSLISPCRSLGSALLQTTAGGEIVVLDSAGYGTVVIDRAVTITVPEGVYAGITVPAYGIGVKVAAGAFDVVLLRGLSINGQGAGAGIKLTSALSLVVDRCTIRGFADPAFFPVPTAALWVEGPGRFHVRNSFFVRNSVAVLVGSSTELYRGTIEHSTFAETGSGVSVFASIDLVVTDTVISGTSNSNSGTGISLGSSSVDASRIQITRTSIGHFGQGISASNAVSVSHVSIADSDITQNDTGIVADVGGFIWLTGTRVTHNGTGVSALLSPVATSGTNFFAWNGTDGGPLLPPSGIK
ncbi:MAG: hypothetical protein ABI569_13485 [Casimicrobiaceae bacterium]